MKTTEEKLLNIMAGHSAQSPLTLDAMSEKIMLAQDALTPVLSSLVDRRAMNSATVTRNGKTQTVYWPTGVIAYDRVGYGRAPAQRPMVGREETRHSIAPPVAPIPIKPPKKEEQIMKTTPTQKPARQQGVMAAMLAIITATPGITQAEATNAFCRETGLNTTKAAKAIWDLINTAKKVRGEGKAGVRILHPLDSAPAVIFRPHKNTTKRTKPKPKPKPTPVTQPVAPIVVPAPSAARPEDDLELMISDDGRLRIDADGHIVNFSADDTQRLQAFLFRTATGIRQ